MARIIFDNISRDLELLVASGEGRDLRGRINLSRIIGDGDDFVLEGLGHTSGKKHRFNLRDVHEIIDMESGENVDIAEFRNELKNHPA